MGWTPEASDKVSCSAGIWISVGSFVFIKACISLRMISPNSDGGGSGGLGACVVFLALLSVHLVLDFPILISPFVGFPPVCEAANDCLVLPTRGWLLVQFKLMKES